MPINKPNYNKPKFLKRGDQIEIIASARYFSRKELILAINNIESFGYSVKCDINFDNKKDIFSDSKTNRIRLLQRALDNKDNKAVFFARGGYGTIQLIDYINFDLFIKSPKWVVGFSDITIVLMHIFYQYNVKSIHGPMPYNYKYTLPKNITELFHVLSGKFNEITIKGHDLNNEGDCSGILIGGNLSIISSLIGSQSIKTQKNTILLIEEVDEYLYHIERMMYTLKRSKLLANLNGVIVGSMTNIKDNDDSFGKNAYQIISDICNQYNYPICFNFPAGHNKNNHPLVMGQKINLNVTQNSCTLKYIM